MHEISISSSTNDLAFDGYKVIKKIGQGGFCAVYKAEQTNLDRLVAIKTLLNDYYDDLDMTTYLVSQTETIALLQHPNIVPIYDAIWVDKKYLVVMEYIAGKTLANLLDEQGSLTFDQTLKVLEPLAEAIDFAHRANIFHRDINPTNIIVDQEQKLNLIGFKMKVPEGVVVGTPGYMSPEQIMNEAISARTDIYSLGVLAFELLAGTIPFQEGSLTEMFYKQVNSPIPSLYLANPTLPKDIDEVIKKALVKNPNERYYSAKDFLYDLKQLSSKLIVKEELSITQIIPSIEEVTEPVLLDKVITHTIAIPCEQRPTKNIPAEQKVKIKNRWAYLGIPKLRLLHPKDGTSDDFVIIGAMKLDDGDYLMLAERLIVEKNQHLILIKVIDKHTVETVTAEVVIKYLGRIQEEVLEQTSGISKTMVRSMLGDLPVVSSENELETTYIEPILINCFACNEKVGHTESTCSHCGVERLAPNCPQCNKPVADWQDKRFFGDLNVYVWNSDWNGYCKHCGLVFEANLDVKTGHYWFDRGPSSEIKITGNESSTTVLLDFWQHLPTIEVKINRLVPGGKLAKEEKITLTIAEFEAIKEQLQGPLQVLMQRKSWSEDTT